MTEHHDSQAGMPYPPAPASGDTSENLLRHYAGVLVRRWRWIALGLVVGLIGGAASAVLIQEKPETTRYYKATNTLVHHDLDRAEGGSYNLSQAALQAESLILLDRVGESLGLSRNEVAASVDATVRPDFSAIDVTAIGTQPEAAVQLADTAAETLQVLSQSEANTVADASRQELQDRMDDLIAERDRLRSQIGGDEAAQLLRIQQIERIESDIRETTAQLDELPSTGSNFSLEVLQPATPIQINARGYNYRRSRNMNARSRLADPNTSNSAAPDFDELDLSTDEGLTDSTRILLGGAAGLVLGLISAFVLEAWDDRVRRRDRVEELTGLGVLTEIPKLARDQVRNHHVAIEDDSTGLAAERFRSARTAVTFGMDGLERSAGDGPPVLMVTSPGPSEGKTTTVANLAAAYADDGYRVLVIDGDFRRPTVRRYLTPVPNLVAPDEPAETRIPGVAFLPGPHDAPTPEIANDRLAKAVEARSDGYDLVILDTPPILTTNDAVELLHVADAVLLVLRADRTRANAARRVAELLAQYQANVLGVVLNSCDRAEMNQYYGYGYGYGYGYLGRNATKPGRGGGTDGAVDATEANPKPEPGTDGAARPPGDDAGLNGTDPTSGADTAAISASRPTATD